MLESFIFWDHFGQSSGLPSACCRCFGVFALFIAHSLGHDTCPQSLCLWEGPKGSASPLWRGTVLPSLPHGQDGGKGLCFCEPLTWPDQQDSGAGQGATTCQDLSSLFPWGSRESLNLSFRGGSYATVCGSFFPAKVTAILLSGSVRCADLYDPRFSFPLPVTSASLSLLSVTTRCLDSAAPDS